MNAFKQLKNNKEAKFSFLAKPLALVLSLMVMSQNAMAQSGDTEDKINDLIDWFDPIMNAFILLLVTIWGGKIAYQFYKDEQSGTKEVRNFIAAVIFLILIKVAVPELMDL